MCVSESLDGISNAAYLFLSLSLPHLRVDRRQIPTARAVVRHNPVELGWAADTRPGATARAIGPPRPLPSQRLVEGESARPVETPGRPAPK
jgi:hypothetical protein